MRGLIDHATLIVAGFIMCAPLAMVFLAAVTPGGIGAAPAAEFAPVVGFLRNLAQLQDFTGSVVSLGGMVTTSLLTAGGIAMLTTLIAFLAAYSINFMPGWRGSWALGLTLLTLYFPVEARLLTTFDVAVTLGLVDTLAGLILPVLPLALATFIFRQHMRQFPPELLEAARLDGAGPIRFLIDFALPLSMVPIGAVLLITFIIGWNQYLWPLMISVDNSLFPIMRGLNLVGTGSGPGMVLAAASTLPPVLLVLGFLRLLGRVTQIRP